MRKRTKAREVALQLLYQIDITKNNLEDASKIFWSEYKDFLSLKSFVDTLVIGTITNLPKIDPIIEKYTKNWRIKRMATVDRNILRMAVYELMFLEDIPPKVSINEAIDVAKKFGDSQSGMFVNGILDKIKQSEIDKKK